jgi:demethylmenaquinone methyltransferase/2-methoxy-6-polyprenyl-1,4-benzoquinol methylase
MRDRLDGLLDEQILYYRRRADEYDNWFHRKGRYDRGEAQRRSWFEEVEEVRRKLDAAKPRGRVLELACGTGLWTERLAPHADSVTALDTSPEVIVRNSARVASDRVRYLQVDLFSWQPDQAYDFVFFGFWLSHVPEARFEAFWRLVQRACAPGATIFFVDNRREPTSNAVDQRPGSPDDETVRRRLEDGSEFTIIKRFFEPVALEHRLRVLGFDFRVQETANYFVHGLGRLV